MTNTRSFTLAELAACATESTDGAGLSAADGQALVTALAHDSRQVGAGTLFFCVTGTQSDGHAYGADAVAAGAVALVVERLLPELKVPQVLVTDSRGALARVAELFYDYPSQKMRVTGITGTNGKTTTAFILESLLKSAGRTTGLIGTVATHLADIREPAGRTTPDALELQRLLARMREAGVTDVVMEVSSHALDLERVRGVRFACTAFTNLSQDHLDWHHDMEQYFGAKKKLFCDYEVAARVINTDDAWGRRLFAELQDGGCAPFAVGAWPPAGQQETSAPVGGKHGEPDLSFDPAQVDFQPDATDFTLRERGGGPRGDESRGDAAGCRVHVPLVGAYNVHNVLIAVGCALHLGLNLEQIAAALPHIAAVPGRLQHVDEGQDFTVLVDYAHTDDALRTALTALRQVTPGRLITVFGCGGDRDRAKRPLMGRAAGECSDYVIATSDNPRSEDPDAILREINAGLKECSAPFELITDRATAIAAALGLAQAGDCVFIAGKGHETYQIFADRTIHFDDREVAAQALRRLQDPARGSTEEVL